MIHFLAYSGCQLSNLILNLNDVKILHKVFTGLKSCSTAIQQVTIFEHFCGDYNLHEGTVSLLNELSQIDSVRLEIMLDNMKKTVCQAFKDSLKNVLIRIKAIKSVWFKVAGNNKHLATRNAYEGLIEGITHDSSLVSDLVLEYLTIEDFEYLFSLLNRWNFNIRLDTLSASKHTCPNCHEEKQCHEFCSLLSTFLSKNVSLRKITMSLPFTDNHFRSCIDTIQAGLDQNSILEYLTLTKKIIFQRNKHSSKLELVKGHKLLQSQSSQAAINKEQDDANQPVAVPQCVEISSAVPQLGTNSIQTKCRMSCSDSESPCVSDDVDSYNTSPAKRRRVGNSNKESPLQATQVHVQPQLNPQLPQPSVAASSSSCLPTLTHSSPLCLPLYSSQCATTCPQSEPASYCIAGSSSSEVMYHSPSRNYQIIPQQRNDHQYSQSWTNMWIPMCIMD